MSRFVRLIGTIGAVLVVASCASSPGERSSGPTTSSPTVTTPTASPTISTAPSATPSPAPEAANLVVTPEVRRAIEGAYASHVATKIPFNVGYVAGEEPGTVYYGYYAPTATYWAMAGLTPSQAAIDRYRQLPSDSALNPLNYFQDGPFIFSRPAGGQWHFVTETGGTVCSPPIPKKLLVAWSIPPPANESCRNIG